MSYEGEDWIFFDNAYLSYEGNTTEIIFDRYKDKKTDNSGGFVWEWIIMAPSEELIKYLHKFSKSSRAKMRLVGKYSKTRTLTKNELVGMSLVLDGYEAFKSGVAK